jgi:two-component system cell cycle sensor histidine kinase/response regulator CckA
VQLITELVAALPIPAQLWAPDGTVTLTNRRFNELLSLPPELDWHEAGLNLLTDPQIESAGLRSMLERAFHGLPSEIPSFVYDPSRLQLASAADGDLLKLFLTIRPLIDDSGQLACVVCLIADYQTIGVRYEHELMRSQKMENIETLAGGVAHEFNNIFTGIKGMTELIKDEVDPHTEIYEFAQAIQANIVRGAELIQQLSSFAREVPYTLRHKRLSDYLHDALPLMQIQVQKRVRIKLDLRADGEVLLDSNRMDQALANVLLNAREAMGGQGDILVKVTSALPLEMSLPGNETDWLMIEVADSGPGIPDELRQRVLEPFFSTKDRGKATGLGLSVTSRIVASHGGLVEISRSADLGGAAIRFYLPIIPPAAAA